MRIRFDDPSRMVGMVLAIERALASSRFTIDPAITFEGKATIKLRSVRLRQAKPYCGNHAGPCRVGRPSQHRRLRYLEGADWVEFNDLINNVLDQCEVSAKAWTSVCVIRVGRCRRVEYNGYILNGEWHKTGKHEDWCGRAAPRSTYPSGTPGGSRQ